MKTYELTYIISPENTSETAEAKAKEIESQIQAGEGTVLKQVLPMPKTLAYPIKKYGSGFAGLVEFQMEPEKFPEFEDFIRKDGKIVRHMLVSKKPEKPAKQPRVRMKPAKEAEPERQEIKEEKPASPKVELEDIDKKLDELLGE